jgi:sigma-54 specific flagellar transcriptional regulator A
MSAQELRFIGCSAGIKMVQSLVERLATRSTTALILGESGTGKELVAQMIHQSSTRAAGPFIALNCAAIPLDLLESELFGHEKGAFTGAFALRQGRFEAAAGGSLFLDEIGDMPFAMQAKLLRVLQEHIFERVGSSRSIKSNVRVIAATHQDLGASMRAGRFREDLFYRLNVFPIQIPPLRERPEDIPLLVDHFIRQQSRISEGTIQISPEVLAVFRSYAWPGNVRELWNLMERLSILYPNQSITKKDLPEPLCSAFKSISA